MTYSTQICPICNFKNDDDENTEVHLWTVHDAEQLAKTVVDLLEYISENGNKS